MDRNKIWEERMREEQQHTKQAEQVNRLGQN